KSGSNYIYEYVLKDHLGNTRSGFVADAPATAMFVTDYFPFGLKHSLGNSTSSPENHYLYNGKELQTFGYYDYGARFYDPVIGRFGTIDRFAEKYYGITPYQYGALNPIKFVDINGDSLRISHKGQEYLYENGKLYQNDAE